MLTAAVSTKIRLQKIKFFDHHYIHDCILKSKVIYSIDFFINASVIGVKITMNYATK